MNSVPATHPPQKAAMSLFTAIEMAPRDPILGLTEQFNADPNPAKVNLGVGVYNDDSGKLPLLQCVAQAERQMLEAAKAHGYLPIDGIKAYDEAVQGLVFGAHSEAVTSGRVVTVQAVGGTGGLKLGADFLKKMSPTASVFISDPSWENHRALFSSAGFAVDAYPYYDAQGRGIRFEAMLAALSGAAAGSIVSLHACCHNPTGVDLSADQWRELIPLIHRRRLIPYVDIAYQGFGDGLVQDAFAVRALAEFRGADGSSIAFFCASSFSKSFSLYGERCGGLSVVCADREQAQLVLGQLKATVRRNYSSPPTHGGQIVARVLGDPSLHADWAAELDAMRSRIRAMRTELHAVLSAKLPGRDFGYFLTQRGMFSYTGLTPEQVDRLRNEHAVYLVRSGRMCVAGLNSANVEATAVAMAAVLAD